MIVLRQKVFHIDMKTGQVVSTADLLKQKQSAGGSLVSALGTAGSNAAAADAAKVAQRAANKANGAAIGAAAKKANAAGFANGVKAGQNSATINKNTIKNTGVRVGSWMKANPGKAAVGALAVGGTILAAKKLLKKDKKEE